MCLFYPLQHLHQIFLHLNIYRSIPIKRTTSLNMSGQGRNKIRILDELVNITDEGASRHMAVGDFVDWYFLLFAGDGI